MNDLMKETRTCRLCNEVKPLELFEIDSRCEGLYTTRCKSCKQKSHDKATHAFNKLCQRAQQAGTEVEVTLTEIKALFMAFDGTCIYCGAQEKTDGPTFHLEHCIPRSQGGRDHISNLVISCPTCNFKKNSKPVVSFYFNEERFKDENFAVLTHYLALSAGQPVSALLESLVVDHADYHLKKMWTEMSK